MFLIYFIIIISFFILYYFVLLLLLFIITLYWFFLLIFLYFISFIGVSIASFSVEATSCHGNFCFILLLDHVSKACLEILSLSTISERCVSRFKKDTICVNSSLTVMWYKWIYTENIITLNVDFLAQLGENKQHWLTRLKKDADCQKGSFKRTVSKEISCITV